MLRTITRPAGRPGELSSVHHHQPVRRYRCRGRGQLGFLHTRHTGEPTPTRQSRRRCTSAAGSGAGSGASARAIAYLRWHEVQHISAGRDGADVNQGLQRILTAPPHSPQWGALNQLHGADTEDGSLPASVFSPFALPDSQRLWTIRSTTSVRGGALANHWTSHGCSPAGTAPAVRQPVRQSMAPAPRPRPAETSPSARGPAVSQPSVAAWPGRSYPTWPGAPSVVSARRVHRTTPRSHHRHPRCRHFFLASCHGWRRAGHHRRRRWQRPPQARRLRRCRWPRRHPRSGAKRQSAGARDAAVARCAPAVGARRPARRSQAPSVVPPRPCRHPCPAMMAADAS